MAEGVPEVEQGPLAVVAGVFGFSGLLATWNHDGRADALFGELVTGSYFGTLGMSPADGRWITPEEVPVRFDTRFYVALAPPHASPKADDAEITEVAWMSPGAALDRHAASASA